MASRSDGVQQLLSAERSAAEKVNEARKRKARRIKQAKDEAHQEVEAYRLERETKYKELEQMTIGTRSNLQAEIDKKTMQQLITINEFMEKNKELAIEKLLRIVCDITPELHSNYHK